MEPLKILFDTGSDAALCNHHALPKGANLKTIERIPVSGVHGVALLKQRVPPEGISLPEFGPTKKVSGLSFNIPS